MLKDKIIELSSLGYTWKQIQDELGCSDYPIMYWLHPDYRERVRESQKIKRKRGSNWRAKLQGKIDRFKDRQISPNKHIRKNNGNKVLSRKIIWFKKKDMCKNKFGLKDVLDKFGTSTICYLTGEAIDLMNDDYNLDHIIPICKGGSCELDNLGITTPIANACKATLTEDEFVELCKKVLIHHGYEVNKKDTQE